jgi:hypothetical protein
MLETKPLQSEHFLQGKKLEDGLKGPELVL